MKRRLTSNRLKYERDRRRTPARSTPLPKPEAGGWAGPESGPLEWLLTSAGNWVAFAGVNSYRIYHTGNVFEISIGRYPIGKAATLDAAQAIALAHRDRS